MGVASRRFGALQLRIGSGDSGLRLFKLSLQVLLGIASRRFDALQLCIGSGGGSFGLLQLSLQILLSAVSRRFDALQLRVGSGGGGLGLLQLSLDLLFRVAFLFDARPRLGVLGFHPRQLRFGVAFALLQLR